MKNKTIDQPVLVLVGPTAIGKTPLSLELAHRFNCEIVSVDSMQIYKYMDIGTAKVTDEEMGGIAHHLIDIIEPHEPYDAAQFTKDAIAAIKKIHRKEKIPLLTGGTGLYLKALTRGILQGPPSNIAIRDQFKKRLESEGPDVLHEELAACDSVSAAKIHKNDSQRLLRALEIFHSSGKPWSAYRDSEKIDENHTVLSNILQIALSCDRDTLYDRINLRTEIMLESGFEEEVRNLLERGYGPNLKSMSAIGYRHMANYILGNWQYEEMKRLLARDTRRYAKRQLTWFTKNDELHWIDSKDITKITALTKRWLTQQSQSTVSPVQQP